MSLYDGFRVLGGSIERDAGHKILENGISIQHKDSFEFFTFSLANHDVKRTQMRALVPRQN